ncbi:hypothetical protein PHMEG_00036198 [Phytophthora megakarya]|uniref:Uncharacterized protein n=1 Tax=Phytophthora megakarya TaxID=4795 RepID=A0A225UM27_9STRA|nr:hypothetical protein PHMEG_00036198 [Phytophthora megakarya]
MIVSTLVLRRHFWMKLVRVLSLDFDTQVKDDGIRYTLYEQMDLLDDQEPARVQWNICASDDDRIKHLPEKYPLKLLKGSQRSSQKNRVTMDFD